MKTRIKRVLCAVLALCLSIAMMPAMTMQAEAASVTLSAADVANYVNSLVGTSYPSGYCLAFVADCFENLGATRSSACCAYNYGNSHIQSTDSSNIPIGADVFFENCGGTPSSSHSCNSPTFGHIGIYVGDGYFVHATGGTVQKGSLSSSYWGPRFRGWGYHGNVTISGGTASNNHTADDTYTAYLPIYAYAVSTGNITVYNSSGIAYSNRYITGSTDLCIIQEIYTDGWCQVKYPSSAEASGYFTAYVKVSEFIPNALPATWTAGSSATAYRRSTGSDTIGSVSAGDSGLRVSSANGRIQVVYPVTGKGYYKMGWVDEGTSGSGNTGTTAPNYLLPCYSYPISTGNISVYDANHNKYSNRYITGSTDQCIIREIYTDGWCYVSYPSSAESDGWFEAYVPLSEFISNANPVSWTATGNYTAYRHSSGSDTIGSIDSGDSCVVVSEANGRMQVMYPVSGKNYYKMGWIDASLANNPQGMVDSLSGGIYSIHVRGWAFDKDDMGTSLEIHVYVGGVCHAITANAERTDVNNAYGCGNYHGYEATIDVDKSLAGNQTVEVYAINVGSGTNVLLGSGTVTIGSDTTAPVISDVSVTDISAEGYTVTCTVTDENGIDRVQFPTWTSHNGQDDLFADWTVNYAASGTKSGNTYTYRIHTSAHNYEGGEYITHIYAFDKYGNQAQYNVPAVQVPIDVISVDFDSLELEFTKAGETSVLTAFIYPENATDQTLTWESSDTTVATVNNGIVTATGSGTATITATAENGVYAMCTVTVAETTLESIQIATRPAKTSYYVGDTLDTTGLVLKATYSDGTTEIITDGYYVSGFDSTTAGTKTVAVTYEGLTATFTVTVTEPAPDSNAQIIVESKSAAPGETVTVTISIKNNPGIASIKLKVAFEDDLALTNVVYNSNIGGQYMQPSSMNSPVTLNWFNGLADTEGDWVFVTLTFTVAEDAAAGTNANITVSYDPNDLYNITETNIPFAVVNGTIEIVDYTPGDINGDGEVNNKDLTRLFRYLSGYDAEVVGAALDVNGDGSTNNKDLTRLFQYLSGWEVTIN